MKIIRKSEADKVFLGKTGRDSVLRKNLLLLEVGDLLELDKTEWHLARPPYHIIASIKRTLNRTFEYRQKPDKSGWWFRRLT